jgi:hypothetical protein
MMNDEELTQRRKGAKVAKKKGFFLRALLPLRLCVSSSPFTLSLNL